MSKSLYWQKSSVQYNGSSIANTLKNFRREDLADPVSARRWFQFAKNFSQMTLTQTDIEQLGFEHFYVLKQIMAATLGNLSEETVNQNDRIVQLQKEERVLKRDLDNLTKIQKENGRKEERLREEFDKLERK